MSNTQGSEQRQRHRDVRIRLNDTEFAQFDQLVLNEGFGGDHARGDWLRSHLPGVVVIPTAPCTRPTVHPWVDVVGAIDGLAVEIAGLQGLLDRMINGRLHFSDIDRLQKTMPGTVARILTEADALVSGMRQRLDAL